jgi:hypothetical protein
MMKEALAAALDGHAIGKEISRVMAEEARIAGLVVIFGGSDDCLELRGAIDKEVGAFNGTTILLTPEGLWDDHACEAECQYYRAAHAAAKAHGATIDALWDTEEPYAWTYRTTIPHTTFDILEDGQPWCRGIVFRLADAHR